MRKNYSREQPALAHSLPKANQEEFPAAKDDVKFNRVVEREAAVPESHVDSLPLSNYGRETVFINLSSFLPPVCYWDLAGRESDRGGEGVTGVWGRDRGVRAWQRSRGVKTAWQRRRESWVLGNKLGKNN